MNTFITAFLLSLSLIFAIGAQNAFILRQGLKKEHVFWVCLICALSDFILITAGVLGFGTLINKAPSLEAIMRFAGGLFLTVYGLRSLYSGFKQHNSLTPSDGPSTSRRTAILTCLAFTWLNPHVYLDTLVLIGSFSTQYAHQQPQFIAGALTASVTFFFSLGYGARLLRPIFAQPRAWQILDVGIGLLMLGLAYVLCFG
ncbi:MAG: amino acid transporter [Neisseriaceae bacterium]|nr:amino acid transporter [Neisseriaceae bacterium]MBP6861411.1 amino acid transporter [Neisseriaceae bacterium]